MAKRQGLTNKELAQLIRENMVEINARVKDLKEDELQTGIKSEFLNNQLTALRAITKTKSKNKVATGNLSKFNKTRLQRILLQQKLFLGSKWSTKEGREEIFNQQLKTLQNTNPDLSAQDLRNFQSLMSSNNNILNSLLEQARISSDQLLEIAKNYDDASIVKTFSEMKTQLTEKQLYDIGVGNYKDFVTNYLNQDKDMKNFYNEYINNQEQDEFYLFS